MKATEIVAKMAEIASVKLSAVSKSRRPILKIDKDIYRKVKEAEEAEGLTSVVEMFPSFEEMSEGMKRCLEELEVALKEEKKEVAPVVSKEEEEGEEKVSLTSKEMGALLLFGKEGEEEGFTLADIANSPQSERSLRGLCSSLSRKGLVEMNEGKGYCDGRLTKRGWEVYRKNSAEVSTEGMEKKAAGTPDRGAQFRSALQAAKAKIEEKKKEETAPKSSKTPKTSIRKVGDVHPNGLWVWTEYKPGKFDWRTKDKKVRTPKETSTQKTASTKKSSSAKEEGKKKEITTAVTRKRATIEDVIRLRPASVPNFTAAQKRAWKLIRQGWRREGIFLTNGTKRERVGEETLSGMWEKLGIKFIPVGFIATEE